MDGLAGWLALLRYRQRVHEAEARARLSWDLEPNAGRGDTSRGHLVDHWGSIAGQARRLSRDAGPNRAAA